MTKKTKDHNRDDIINDYDFDDENIVTDESGNNQNNEHGQNQNNDNNNDVNNDHESNHNDTNNENITVSKLSDWENNEEIQIFREYLRIPTVHPDINYSKLSSGSN